MTAIARQVMNYDDLRDAYLRALLTWESMILDGDHEGAAVVRMRVINLRGRAETAKVTLSAHGVEV